MYPRKGNYRRLTYEHVKEYIETHKCYLLSPEYHNAHDILDLQCACGQKFQKSWACFKAGQRRCKKCTHRSLLTR